jgi:hypothetical protein
MTEGLKAFASREGSARLCMWALCLGGLISSELPRAVYAAPVGGQFNVTVNLISSSNPPPINAAFCRATEATAFGALVTVVCSTGEVVDISAPANSGSRAPTHGGAYRYILRRPGELPLPVDSFSELGTVATWRVIQQADRNYLELMVGW